MSHSIPQTGEKLILFGAGGHARVLIDSLLSITSDIECVLLDADKSRHGSQVFSFPILGDDSLIPTLVGRGFSSFAVAMGGIGQFGLRRRLFERAVSAGLEPRIIRHNSAVISPNAVLEGGVQVLAGAVINASALVREDVIINTGAIVEHDCVVGRHVHLAPRSCILGGATIEDEVHLGAGAIIRENLRIGARAVVGAGAVVVRDVPPDTTVVGVPAVEIRRSNNVRTS